MSLLDDFVVRAAVGGLGVALAAAPLGCFVVWRRMAYFSDATAHAAILGVALALALDTSITAMVLVSGLAMALVVSFLSGRSVAADTILGVAAHAALAFGLVAVSFLSGVRVDLMSYLFGDILSVGRTDLLVIWCGAALVIGLIVWRWTPLLTATLSAELAYAAGIDPRREHLVLTLALALVVAVAIQVVGALLIASLLIIPAAAARPLATTPERMALIAGVLGVTSVLGGMRASLIWDTPTGPTIVATAAVLFAITSFGSMLRTSIGV
ncbi:MAG: metal ABC transporter permease [Pseudomonadota bacterium]